MLDQYMNRPNKAFKMVNSQELMPCAMLNSYQIIIWQPKLAKIFYAQNKLPNGKYIYAVNKI